MHSSDFVVMKILVVLFFVIHSRKHKYLSLWEKKQRVVCKWCRSGLKKEKKTIQMSDSSASNLKLRDIPLKKMAA